MRAIARAAPSPARTAAIPPASPWAPRPEPRRTPRRRGPHDRRHPTESPRARTPRAAHDTGHHGPPPDAHWCGADPRTPQRQRQRRSGEQPASDPPSPSPHPKKAEAKLSLTRKPIPASPHATDLPSRRNHPNPSPSPGRRPESTRQPFLPRRQRKKHHHGRTQPGHRRTSPGPRALNTPSGVSWPVPTIGQARNPPHRSPSQGTVRPVTEPTKLATR
jgi:hypothetical protein